MGRSISLKTILKNCFLSVLVQFVSLFTTFVLGFIVPKFVDELNYAYWQAYTLYATYTGVLHFGILDGLILRYSGTDYADFDKKKMRSQLAVVFGLNLVTAVVISAVSSQVLDWNYFLILSIFALAVVTKNVFLYFSYALQIANRVKPYAAIVIIQKGVYLVGVAALLIAGVQDFYWYCLADIVGDVVGIIVGAAFNKGL